MGGDLLKRSHVPVVCGSTAATPEDILFVIIANLHNLVPHPKHIARDIDLGLSGTRRIDILL